MKNSKGFTLIELLVVIAIIGILSSVVLASLNTARLRGADGSIKSSLSNARSQAELFYDTTGGGTSYDGVCTTGANNISAQVLGAARNILSSAVSVPNDALFAYSSSGSGNYAVCNDTQAGWAAIVSLKGSATGWCVDSSGAATSTTVLTASSVTCGS